MKAVCNTDNLVGHMTIGKEYEVFEFSDFYSFTGDQGVYCHALKEYFDAPTAESKKRDEKLPDWEYMLKTCIYTSLLGYRESSGYSIPCKTRGEIEDAIVGKFKKRLKEGNYDIAKPYLPYRLIELEACLGQALAVLSELKENTRYITWGENETHFEDTDEWAVLCDTVKKAKLLLNPDKENKV